MHQLFIIQYTCLFLIRYCRYLLVDKYIHLCRVQGLLRRLHADVRLQVERPLHLRAARHLRVSEGAAELAGHYHCHYY